MNWKPQDWIEHAAFGLGRVNESRGDRLDIDFINSGAKTILMTTELKRANPPSLDFEFTHKKRKSGPSGVTRGPQSAAEPPKTSPVMTPPR
jgi:hypothetical protein